MSVFDGLVPDRTGAEARRPTIKTVPKWGGDVVFIHAASTGTKKIALRPGQKLKKLLGPVAKDELKSGEEWFGEAGCTYGFLVENTK